MEVFSPKKKLKTENDTAVTPAINRMKNFHVGKESADERDTQTDDSFEGIDMDAFMAEVEEIRRTGGVKFEDVVAEVERMVRGHE